jgi:hypothetical protein
LSLSILLAVVIVCSVSDVSRAVRLDFGTPIVPDQSLGIIPIGSFPADRFYNDFHVATSDNYTLLLAATPWTGVWSTIRLTHSGDLVDTIPHQLRSPDNQFSGKFYGLTWSSPYFYLWEIADSSVYFTRFTEDLTLKDQVARRLCTSLGHIALGGSIAWTFRDYPNAIWAFNAATGNAVFNLPVGPSGWRPLSGVTMGGVVDTGAFIYRANPLDMLCDLAYVSPEGTAQVLASQSSSYYPAGGVAYSKDSALFWTYSGLHNDTEFVYYFASPLDSGATQTLHFIDLPGLPSDYSGYNSRFAVRGHLGLLTGPLGSRPYSYFAATIDVSSDSLLSYQLLDFRSHLSTSIEIALAADGCSIAHKLHNGIQAISLSGPEIASLGEPHPVLYGRGYSSSPIMIQDSLGLLVYVDEATTKGSGVVGYRWNSPIISDLANPVRIYPPTLDSAVYDQFVFDFEGGRGLFWREGLSINLKYQENISTRQRLCVFNGDSPTLSDVSSAFFLDSAAGDRYLPPSATRIGDTLYVISGVGSEPWYLRSFCLPTHEESSRRSVLYSLASPILLGRSDTLMQLGLYQSCKDWCGNIGCCTWYKYVYDHGYVGENKVIDFHGQFPDIYGWPDFYPVLRGGEMDGQYVLTVADPPMIFALDFDSHSSSLVADLTYQLGAPTDWRSEPEMVLVPRGDYRIVFYFRHDDKPQKALIFDRNWQLIDRIEVPLLGAEQELAGVAFSADSSQMVLVYSSFLPYPYSTERLVVQPFSLDEATDVSGGTATPGSFGLNQNYPNPFNPTTTIEYGLPVRSHVTIDVYNMLGQVVCRLLDREESAGDHTVVWDGTDESGKSVATGIYLYHLQAGDKAETKKMLLLK